MAIIRVKKTNDYTVMSNYHFKDKKLSLKAKGLLSLMLSLPDSWDYTISGLVSICKENETAIKSTLEELKVLGYLEIIKKMPNETESGRIEYEYNVYEKPKQEGKKQEVENLGVEFQGVENQGQLNTNNQVLNNKNKKERKKNYDDILNENNLSERIVQSLKDFIQMRVLIKKPMTNRALELCIMDLRKLSNNEDEQVAIIEQSIKKNWQGLYPLKENNIIPKETEWELIE